MNNVIKSVSSVALAKYVTDVTEALEVKWNTLSKSGYLNTGALVMSFLSLLKVSINFLFL